jgi:hypothetical protein
MRLLELTFENAGSYGPRAVLGPLGTVNALVGKNNAGKSNVFRLLTMAIGWPTTADSAEVRQLPMREGAWHMGWGREPFYVTLLAEFAPAEIDLLKPDGVDDNGRFFHGVRCDPLLGQDGRRLLRVTVIDESREPVADSNQHTALVQHLRGRTVHLPIQRHVTLEQVSSAGLGQISSYDGSQLKRWLNDVLSPRTKPLRLIRDQFLSDIRSVDGFQELTFDVAIDDNAQLGVLVTDGEHGYPTPLEDCGAGLQMVAIVLAAQHMLPGSIVLIDDVENNLHPLVQEQFCQIVSARAQTVDGQVIFTTHPPAMLDHLPDDAVFEVERVAGSSVIRSPQPEARPLTDILRSLGHRPSLLRMADVVVFVEGPSDEAVLRVWWQAVFGAPPEPSAVFLPLGGTNMKHLTGETVRGLGRDVVIVLDSDKGSPDAEISVQARDLTSRLAPVAKVHILERRTIESYFSTRAIQQVLHLPCEPSIGPFDKLSNLGLGYGKSAHAAAIAAAMRPDEIPTEISDLLREIRSHQSLRGA